MSVQRKKYSKEFKRQIIELNEQGKPMSEICREYGIRTSMGYQWKKNYGTKGVTLEGETVTLAEYRKLQKKLAQVEMENEILKKATAIFARKQD